MIKWIKGLFKRDPPPVENKVLVWGITDGPYNKSDFPDEELLDEGIPEDWDWMIVAKIEVDGKIGSANLWYSTLDDAYSIIKYFDTNIEPLELD